jgi:hypothetical protein
VLTGLAQGPRQQVVRQAPMALDRLFRGATVAAVQQQQQQQVQVAVAAAMAAMSVTLAAMAAAFAALRRPAYRSGMQGASGSPAHQTPPSGRQHQVCGSVLDPCHFWDGC